MRKLIWISDLHWGLSTDEIDRTDEITSIAVYAAKYAVKHKAAWFVFGGDIFHNNQPSEELISCFIRVLNILTKANIRVFVMDGNHDKYSKVHRKSALQFLEKLSARYPNVRWIHDVTTLRVVKGKWPVYFTFLPHIAKVHIPKEYKTPQEYVDARCEDIVNKISFFSQHYVFSHLNVRGAVPGSEEDMLKKSEIFLPDSFHTKSYIDKPFPTTINGHIHTSQKTGFVQIVGSPLFVSFGEKEQEKFFASIDVPETDGETSKVELVPSPCRRFLELNIEVKERHFDFNRAVDSFVKKLTGNEIIKVNATVHENVGEVNWEAIRLAIKERAYYVKPIVPKIVRARIKRNRKQTVRLNPKDAVKLFIKTNKPKEADAILELASEYLERCV